MAKPAEVTLLPRLTQSKERCKPFIFRHQINLKDSTISSLIEKVNADFFSFNLKVRDYWDGDLCAIGFTKSVEDKLIYVSTYNKPSNCYFVTVDDINGKTLETFEEISYGDLKALISKHLI